MCRTGLFHLFAAIECRNLRENFPLLVSCVPRIDDEAWHQITENKQSGWTMLHEIKGDNSRYRSRMPVGKSTAKVGLTMSGDLSANDMEIYEKWGQSLASLHDLVSGIDSLPAGSISIALPILVVPDGRLWQVRYNQDGSRASEPEKVDECPIYAGGSTIPYSSGRSFLVSHVEVMTFSGLTKFCGKLCDDNAMRSLLLGSYNST
jgi:hypothetical protein